MDGAAVEAVPAATVVLVRDTPDGLEVLMLRRGSTAAFGGMWVFPGGRVDPEDDDPAAPGDELATARRAAVREAREEAALEIAPASLVPFSHWIPPPGAPRRFSTWFFLAPAPAANDVLVDGGEIHDHAWLAPSDALARRDAGTIELAPPTWVTLHRLAALADVSAAVAEAEATEPERFETRIGRVDDGLVALWHGDAGYDDGDAARAGPRHRLRMAESGWYYERSTEENP
jgi:8-oxo-dGTP pyrophosphatase MutT (NUDIX family)